MVWRAKELGFCTWTGAFRRIRYCRVSVGHVGTTTQRTDPRRRALEHRGLLDQCGRLPVGQGKLNLDPGRTAILDPSGYVGLQRFHGQMLSRSLRVAPAVPTAAWPVLPHQLHAPGPSGPRQHTLMPNAVRLATGVRFRTTDSQVGDRRGALNREIR